MKKIVANYKLTQKIVLSIVIVLLLSFAIPVKSQAGIGGILLDPLFDLLGTLVDTLVAALQAFLTDGEFGNGEGAGINAFLVDKDVFMTDINNGGAKYGDFKYSTDHGEAQVEISTEDLERNPWGSTWAIPVMKYSPEKIFAGLVPALDINFVDPKDWSIENTDEVEVTDGAGDTVTTTTGDRMNERSITRALHHTIASWYVSLRNLALVALMLILVYIGIRIVISSTASDKAKYKQFLADWVVAMCILFCLHYIMTFTTTIVNEITQTIGGTENNGGNNVAVSVSDGTKFNTDLMGLIRFKMQAPDVAGKILYLVLYIAMTIYTFMFTFYYLKRVLTIAFLTLIAPLVAMTYPIDKMRDGKAQAFDMWLKEYVFNVLVQPFHLIIYSIFVGSAIDLAAKNPLFAIIALAFITPAEKMLRKFFGFEKASSAGTLGAVASIAGGAAVMNQMKSLMSPKKASGGSGGKNSYRTRNKPEGSAPSLESSFGGGTGGNGAEESNSEPSTREALSQTEEPSSQVAPQTQEENMPAVASTDGMHMQGGLWVPNNSSTTSSSSEPPQEPPQEPNSSTDGIHRTGGAFEWSENDTRGVGAYLGDAAKHGASWVANNTGVGRGAVRFGRTVKNGARSIKNIASTNARKLGDWKTDKAQRMGDAVRTHVPKPIRNTARTLGRTAGRVASATGHAALGVGNVALQSGLAVGKAALKAAPGAMLGLAAGIAGDELSDIGKYTLTGAALSSTIGSSAVAQAGTFVADAYRQGAGSSYEAALNHRRKEYVKENEELYEQKFPDASKREIKEKLEQGAYYDSLGIEGKDTIRAVKMQERLKEQIRKQESGIAEDEANRRAQAQTAAIMKEVKEYSAKDLRDADVVKGLREDLSTRLEGQGLTGREKMKTINTIVKEMKTARGVKNDL